jgi:hypothetical protein
MHCYSNLTHRGDQFTIGMQAAFLTIATLTDRSRQRIEPETTLGRSQLFRSPLEI